MSTAHAQLHAFTAAHGDGENDQAGATAAAAAAHDHDAGERAAQRLTTADQQRLVREKKVGATMAKHYIAVDTAATAVDQVLARLDLPPSEGSSAAQLAGAATRRNAGGGGKKGGGARRRGVHVADAGERDALHGGASTTHCVQFNTEAEEHDRDQACLSCSLFSSACGRCMSGGWPTNNDPPTTKRTTNTMNDNRDE